MDNIASIPHLDMINNAIKELEYKRNLLTGKIRHLYKLEELYKTSFFYFDDRNNEKEIENMITSYIDELNNKSKKD